MLAAASVWNRFPCRSRLADGACFACGLWVLCYCRYIIIVGCLIWGVFGIFGIDFIRLCIVPWEAELTGEVCSLRLNEVACIAWCGLLTGPVAIWGIVSTCRHKNAEGQRREMFNQLLPVLIVIVLSFCWPSQTLAANSHGIVIASGTFWLRRLQGCCCQVVFKL